MEAYAKLIGRIGASNDDDSAQKEFLVSELPCYLGRTLLKEGGGIVIDSTDTLLSRQHVKITWSQSGGWKLYCLSKNGCTVNKKKYEKDEIASLYNGSAIRIGNARLYFTLPVVEEIPVQESRKRAHSETQPSADDDDGALIMCLGGIEKGTERENIVKIGNFTSSLASRAKVKNVVGDGDTTSPTPAVPDKQAPIKGDSYLAMIETAFECSDLLRFGDGSIHQTELVNWISAIYVGTLGEIQRQSVCKGVYNALVKNFEKVENGEEAGKPQKRGTIRWRKPKDDKEEKPL